MKTKAKNKNTLTMMAIMSKGHRSQLKELLMAKTCEQQNKVVLAYTQSRK